MTKLANEIDIKLYEHWMKPQVAKLFELEYKISDKEFSDFMSRLYEHPYQNKKCIMIVAVDGDKVVGFQSFFYWPYNYANQTYNSYQSGNSLVHPDYRGKRLFARMLNFISENPIGVNIDFLVGFPVQSSYNSFIKNGWNNLFNLNWHVKVINPFGFLFSKSNLNKQFSKSNSCVTVNNTQLIKLNEEKDFYNWKSQLVYEPENYFQFVYETTSSKVIFDLKIQTRKKIINELIIGNIRYDSTSTSVVEEAINFLVKKAQKSLCVSIISCAINDTLESPSLSTLLKKLKFKKIENKIFFIYKPINRQIQLTNASLWNIGRADIDTW